MLCCRVILDMLCYRVIVDKIDSDNDGKVTEPELVAWIKYIQRRYITEDAKHQWHNYDLKKLDTLSWDYYYNRTYAGMTGNICISDILLYLH